jgi:hypothetical protein
VIGLVERTCPRAFLRSDAGVPEPRAERRQRLHSALVCERLGPLETLHHSPPCAEFEPFSFPPARVGPVLHGIYGVGSVVQVAWRQAVGAERPLAT